MACCSCQFTTLYNLLNKLQQYAKNVGNFGSFTTSFLSFFFLVGSLREGYCTLGISLHHGTVSQSKYVCVAPFCSLCFYSFIEPYPKFSLSYKRNYFNVLSVCFCDIHYDIIGILLIIITVALQLPSILSTPPPLGILP